MSGGSDHHDFDTALREAAKMGASGLPEALTQLAQLLPGRVRLSEMGHLSIKSGNNWEHAGHTTNNGVEDYLWVWSKAPMHLEYALREEIEARGWMWRCQVYPDGLGYTADVQKAVAGKRFAYSTNSPALALSLALIAVLEATR